MDVFNLENQNNYIDNKIVAGLERLSQAFRVLLWEQARVQQLSPIQIQLLIFIRYHGSDRNNVSYLAKEFGVTKPTVSDAIKVLEQKALISKITDKEDNRRYHMKLTNAGKKVVRDTELYTAPISDWLSQVATNEKNMLWHSIKNMIGWLNTSGIITVQRMCYNCGHHTMKNGDHFCNLLNQILESGDIRIDCPEHVPAA